MIAFSVVTNRIFADLEEWETAVQNRKDVTAAEKKSMILSDETLTGLKLTSMTSILKVILYNVYAFIVYIIHLLLPSVKSFIELAS